MEHDKSDITFLQIDPSLHIYQKQRVTQQIQQKLLYKEIVDLVTRGRSASLPLRGRGNIQ